MTPHVLVCPVCGQELESAGVRIIAATCDGAGKHKPRVMVERIQRLHDRGDH